MKFLASIVIILSIHLQAATIDSFLDQKENDFKDEILKHSITVDEWGVLLNQCESYYICLGETHRQNFRDFIAQNIFNKIYFNQLFLETQDKDIDNILTEIENGSEFIDFLGHSDIASVIRSSISINPNLQIFGSEPSDQQQKIIYKNEQITRESFIAYNIAQNSTLPKVISLYGSLHCANFDMALGGSTPAYRHLVNNNLKPNMINVKIIEAGYSEHFSILLEIFKLNKNSFVIPDTNKISPKSYRYNQKLKTLFSNYKTIIFMGEPPQ